MLAGFITRLHALLSRKTTNADLDEEMHYHLEREVDRNIANGMSPEAARNAARRAFGNVTIATEQARDAWRWTMFEELRQDCVYAVRTFRRAPVFVLTVVATIGLGLGLLSSVFTFFNAYVLRPVAVRDPYSLVELHWSSADGRAHRFSWDQFQRLSRDKSVFSEVHAYNFVAPRVNGHATQGQLVSGNYFNMLGVPPALGRTIGRADAETDGGNAVLVLSHQGWMTLYGGDSTVIGRHVNVNGTTFGIIGVTRDGFGGLTSAPFDFWIPITMASAVGPTPMLFRRGNDEGVGIVARLAPGIGEARAHAWLRDWLRAETADRTAPDRAQDVAMLSRATTIPPSPETTAIFAPVIVAFLLVMLIACANVANIMLARGMARQREIGIRIALGAGRHRIVRQLLAEAMLLALPAGFLGWLLSRLTLWAAITALFATMPPDAASFVRLIPLGTDPRVVGFTIFAVLLAAVAFGLMPALQASRPNIVQASRGDFDTQLRPSRLRNALVVGQVTMSVLLLICAGVLLSASRTVAHLDPGVRTTGIIQLELFAPFRARGFDALKTDPSVRDIAAANSTLIDGCCRRVALHAEGGRLDRVSYLTISDNWFSLFELPVVRGRGFTPDEARSRAPVAVISESTARRLWPSADALGKTLSILRDDPEYASLSSYHDARIIGIARDAASGWIGQGRTPPIVYFPQPLDADATKLIVRVDGDAEQGKRRLVATLERVDSAAVSEIHSMDDAVALQVYPFRAIYWVASALGAIALALTLIGVYGVVSYLVAQRRREFGIRLALGAAKVSVIGLVIRQSMRLALLGLFIGVVLALGVSRLFASLIPGLLDTYDPLGYVLGVSLVAVACGIAAFGPSHRASVIDPVEALRHD